MRIVVWRQILNFAQFGRRNASSERCDTPTPNKETRPNSERYRMVSSSVQVVLRFRPTNNTEKEKGPSTFVEFLDEKSLAVTDKESQSSNKTYTFDGVLDTTRGQEEVFDLVGVPTVNSVLKGYNGTILAYGQTGSGKTHSMLGPEGGTVDFLSPSTDLFKMRGIIPRIASALFEKLSALPSVEVTWSVHVSSFELYREAIHDLLTEGPQKEYRIREDTIHGRGIYVDNLFEKKCHTATDLLEAIRIAVSRRTVASTKSNETSSRSHSLTVITLEQINHVQDDAVTVSRLNLVDLAGSEKVGKTQATGDRLKEAQTINLSLTLLGNVIYKLTDGKSGYIPYRNSKLTRILQDSFGGNSTTTLMCHCSAAAYNREETISTLRFASRAKQIKNKPRVNRDLSLKELQLAYAQALDKIKSLEERVQIVTQTAGSQISPSRSRAIESKGDGSSTAQGCSDPSHADLQDTITNLLVEIEDLRKETHLEQEEHSSTKQQVEFYKAKVSSVEAELSDFRMRKRREEDLLQQTIQSLQDENALLKQRAFADLSEAPQLDTSIAANVAIHALPTEGLSQETRPLHRRLSVGVGHIGNLRRLGEKEIVRKSEAVSSDAVERVAVVDTYCEQPVGVTALHPVAIDAESIDMPDSAPLSRDTTHGAPSRKGLANNDRHLQPVSVTPSGRTLVDGIEELPYRLTAECSVQTESDRGISELMLALEEAKREARDLSGQNITLAKKNSEANATIERLGESIEASDSRIDMLLRELDDLKQLLESKEKENRLMRRILEELNINIEEQMALLGSEQQRNAWLSAEADKLRQKARTLQDSQEQQEYCDMANMELLVKTEDMDAVENEIGYLSYSALTGVGVSEGTRLSCLDTLRQLESFLGRLLGTLQGRVFNTGNLESQRLSIVSDALKLQSRVESAQSLLSETSNVEVGLRTHVVEPEASGGLLSTVSTSATDTRGSNARAPTETAMPRAPRRVPSSNALRASSFGGASSRAPKSSQMGPRR